MSKGCQFDTLLFMYTLFGQKSWLALISLHLFGNSNLFYLLLYKKKKYPVDFDDELKIGDIRYDNMT